MKTLAYIAAIVLSVAYSACTAADETESRELKECELTELIELLAAKPDTRRDINDDHLVAVRNEVASRKRKAVPELRKHFADERYSATYTYKLNFGDHVSIINQTVGDQAQSIVETILRPRIHVKDISHFKNEPYFSQYYYQVGLDNYWKWTATANEHEQELAYLNWYVAEVVRRYGDRDWINVPVHLKPFRARVAELKRNGVSTIGPPFRETPQKR